MSVLVAKFSDIRDAKEIAKTIRKHRGVAKLIEDEVWEDFALGKLIDEAEKEGGEIPAEKILTKLQRNGSRRKRSI